MKELRVLDFGRVSAVRSQSLWHAIAHGVSMGAPPTLSFMVPGSPYVSIGYHSDIGAVDLPECESNGIPVYRRMVGGGPVYIDDDQLFFQITMPAATVPALRSEAVKTLLRPAVEAFRSEGIEADIDEANEIVVGDRKICGHAAGQIGSAVVVVGNLITGFNHDAAAAIAQTPHRLAADLFREFLGRYVTAVDADPERFTRAAIDAYADRLSLAPTAPHGIESLTLDELAILAEMDAKISESEFVQGHRRMPTDPWRVKVKSGVWVFGGSNANGSAAIGVVDRIISKAIEEGAGENREQGTRFVGTHIDEAVKAANGSTDDSSALHQLVRALA